MRKGLDSYIIRQQIEKFLKEDIGNGDLTSAAIFPKEKIDSAEMIARAPLVACGFTAIAQEVFKILNTKIEFSNAVEDGKLVAAGSRLLSLSGNIYHILLGERVALNLVQRLSGIATLTHQFVEKTKPLPVKIVDTRKTTPGLRMFEKYAVRCGGGQNHRFNLADGIMIKDNHIAACGSITMAVDAVRKNAPHTLKIEVETDNLSQVEECLACNADIIMLDNMSPSLMKEAVRLIDGQAIIEASGGITLDNVREIAETGVDIISIGALTHSAPSCDIGLDF